MSSKVKMRTEKISLENYLDFILSNKQTDLTVKVCVCVFPVFHLVFKLLNLYISISLCLIAHKLEVESIVNVLINHYLAADKM